MTQLTFTTNEAQPIDVQRSSNIFVYGTWGGGTMTITETLSGVTIRTPATADEGFKTDTRNLTFTLSGATSPSLTINIEEYGASRKYQV